MAGYARRDALMFDVLADEHEQSQQERMQPLQPLPLHQQQQQQQHMHAQQQHAHHRRRPRHESAAAAAWQQDALQLPVPQHPEDWDVARQTERVKQETDEDSQVGGGKNASSYMQWTEAEDTLVRSIVEELQASGEEDALEIVEDEQGRKRETVSSKVKFWNKVAGRVPGRTAKQCRERWKNSLDPGIVHASWNIEEDLRLLEIQSRLGNKWAKIAFELPGRTENGVKTRFKSIQRARKRMWTSQEDALLLQLYRQHGPKWNVLQKCLPRRTVHGVKMRYRALINGAAHKPVELGAPEQSLPFDFKTYFSKHTAIKADGGHAAGAMSPVNVTKKRALIEALVTGEHASVSEERVAKAPRTGPCIVPGFTIAHDSNSGSNASTTESEDKPRARATDSYDGLPLHPLPETNATAKAPPFRSENYGRADAQFASAISDILDGAKETPGIDIDEYNDFEASIAEMLHEQGASDMVPSS